MVFHHTMHLLLAVLLASSYVFSIYVCQPLRVRGKDRNDPVVIRHRLARVTALCVGWLVVVPLWLHHADGTSVSATLRELGLVPGLGSRPAAEDWANVARSTLLIGTLYVGVIVEYLRQGPAVARDARGEFATLHGFRDHVFAPVSEELIYRALVLTVLIRGGWGHTTRSLGWAALLFGIAHVHHAVVLARTTQLPVSMIVANAVFQTVYTTVFGVVATHLYLRHRTLASPAAVHTVCNLLGFPPLSVDGSAAYKVSYYALLLAGVAAFGRLITLF